MTYKEKYHSLASWKARVKVMNIYHHLKIYKEKKWSVRKTADYFGVSIGLTSENLALARILDKIPNVVKRSDALQIMRGTYGRSENLGE